MFWEPHLSAWEVVLEALGLVVVLLLCLYVVVSPFALLHHFLTWPDRRNKARRRAAASKRAAAERKRRRETWPPGWRQEWGEPPQVVMQHSNVVSGNYVYPAPQYPGYEQQPPPWSSYCYPNVDGPWSALT